MLISVSIKKKSFSQHFGAKLTKSKYSDRNQPEPKKKNRKRNVKNISKNTKKKELNPPIYLITKVQFVSHNFRLALPTRKIKKRNVKNVSKNTKKKNSIPLFTLLLKSSS